MRDITFDNIQKLFFTLYLFRFRSFWIRLTMFMTLLHHTCSSRFCSKCGSKAAQQRAAHVSAMAFESKHRHIVFTIPKELRPFFLKDRSLLEGFFTVSRNVLASLFNDCKYYIRK